jgi:hypothetical protein
VTGQVNKGVSEEGFQGVDGRPYDMCIYIYIGKATAQETRMKLTYHENCSA